jgi:hypothetical protein
LQDCETVAADSTGREAGCGDNAVNLRAFAVMQKGPAALLQK